MGEGLEGVEEPYELFGFGGLLSLSLSLLVLVSLLLLA